MLAPVLANKDFSIEVIKVLSIVGDTTIEVRLAIVVEDPEVAEEVLEALEGDLGEDTEVTEHLAIINLEIETKEASEVKEHTGIIVIKEISSETQEGLDKITTDGTMVKIQLQTSLRQVQSKSNLKNHSSQNYKLFVWPVLLSSSQCLAPESQ